MRKLFLFTNDAQMCPQCRDEIRWTHYETRECFACFKCNHLDEEALAADMLAAYERENDNRAAAEWLMAHEKIV